jgi:hypothetical protein
MDFLLNAVSKMINAMAAVLGSWEFGHDLSADINKISPYLQLANWMLPVKTALIIAALWVALQLVLIAYYWITRAINLLRGAG